MSSPQDLTPTPDTFPEHLARTFREASVPEARFAPGQVVFQDGDQGGDAYLVIEGAVHILKESAQGEVRLLNVIEPGGLFGEMALLDQPQRSASAVAKTAVRAFVVSRAQVHQLVATVPQMALWMLSVFSRRLRLTDQRLTQMERIQATSSRILLGHESARRKIAREMREGPVQQFSDFLMRVEICERLARRGDPQLSGELAGLKEALRQGLSRIQTLVSVLSPEQVRSEGLPAVLEGFVERIRQDSGLSIRFECAPIPEDALSFELASTAFAVVQSALMHVQTFARARTVDLKVALTPMRLSLVVTDDGAGYDMEKVRQGYYQEEMESFEAMRERVRLVEGAFRVASQPGRGTRLEVDLPLARGAVS